VANMMNAICKCVPTLETNERRKTKVKVRYLKTFASNINLYFYKLPKQKKSINSKININIVSGARVELEHKNNTTTITLVANSRR
jgi:hypothetical protein